MKVPGRVVVNKCHRQPAQVLSFIHSFFQREPGVGTHEAHQVSQFIMKRTRGAQHTQWSGAIRTSPLEPELG